MNSIRLGDLWEIVEINRGGLESIIFTILGFDPFEFEDAV